MRNKLLDLNNHLFAQLERLGDENLVGEELDTEIMRGKAIAGISSQIISNGALQLKAIDMAHELGLEVKKPVVLQIMGVEE